MMNYDDLKDTLHRIVRELDDELKRPVLDRQRLGDILAELGAALRALRDHLDRDERESQRHAR